ncbi:putative peptidoglycan-binding domain-containing protein [Rivularia sp. PCC 7116]|uniref:peptidoglycan-binding domain-containing protein n=1 Tax=Rivularia sp. PCC 7116 TaxID=373994 RepID=UPI00029EF60F|nr:peptidoglycan-binding protein [Rivularia sp. PCC 7116]AFY55301.1 putative peptidoglycan-binding domain-containing protein [Rivularia sp. PCC 7116]
MENIAYTHAALSYEAEENIEFVPFLFDFNAFSEINRKNKSSFATISFLSISLVLFFLSSIGQALALEKYGNKGASVTTIQKCLKELGYFNSSATGYYGSITKNAVIKFQKDNGLGIDGIVGSDTQKNLQSKCLTQSSASKQTKQADVLQLGSRNQTVKKLQQDLKQLNYFVGNPSGYFGPITKDAVIKFQKDKNLTVDGIVGSTTFSALKQSLTKETNFGIGGENFTLRLGSRSAEVASLQKRLQRLNYFKGKITGYFGPYTRDVTIRFQKDKGLTADGIVGAKTQQAIDKAIQQLKSAKPPSNKILPLAIGSCSNGKCPTLRFGDKNRYVAYLQTRLRQWGYFSSNPNGNYDSKTVEAVKPFQRDNKLLVDGAVGPQTWQRIETPRKPTVKISNKCNKPVLQRGDNNDCVIIVQRILRELGYFKNNPTSYFGSTTWEAVKKFQLNNELPPNGIVDSQTWKALGKSENRYAVVIPVTSQYTLDEVRRIVPDAYIRNSKLGKYVQVGEFQYPEGAQKYSQYLRDRGFNARAISTEKL